MKIKPLLIALSLAANGALALVFSRSTPSAQPIAVLAPTSDTAADVAAIWTELRIATANDDAALVARLRAEGFPPSVIRAIVTVQVSDHFAARRRELETSSDEYAYWKSWSSVRTSNPEARAALRRLWREQSEILRQLLGEDPALSYERPPEEQRYGKLPKEKVEQLEQVVRDYQDLMQQVQSESRGLLLPEDKEKLTYLAREQQKDLAALLSPEELAAYELRSSRTAQSLKYRLLFFDASEQEYFAIYKLQKAYDDRFNSTPLYGPSISNTAENKERSEAQQKLTKDLETALGSERYSDYRITSDFEYRQVTQLAERLNLPATVAKSVVGLKFDVQDRAKAIRSNNTLDKPQREAQLAALAQEATTKLSQQLGADGFAAYRDSHGYWFKNLTPPTMGAR